LHMPLTVGTVGHIDHGKTWLVRALTGKDTDRLPEEQRRGISIDLGYAPLELPGGLGLSLVDVPGHERFVRNMVAGATGIDLFLLVIDAAEGARPQTHEHLAILRLLGIERGVVAVTKADAVDAETLELALDEARELVPDGAAVAVSAKTGQGVERAQLRRGVALVEPGEYPVSYRLDVALDELEPIADGRRLHVHHGTAELYARVVRAGERFAQLRLAAPAVAARGDRVVLRDGTTLGGARVLDPAPPRRIDPARFELLERGELAATVHAPVRLEQIRRLGEPEGVEHAGEWVFAAAWLGELREELSEQLEH